MKKCRILLCLAVVMCMVTALCVCANAAEYSGSCGPNVTWIFDPDTGALEISGTGEITEILGWWNLKPYIKSVSIGSGVTSIGDYSFSTCDSLESITIPDSVTNIGKRAFSACELLETITLPAGVTSIGDYAFDGCSSLISFTVDEGNTAYSSDEYGVLFNKDKTALIQYPAGNTRREYIIPDSVTSIGKHAFGDCDLLASITIPDSVISIGDYAFCYCDSLESVTLPDGVTGIGKYAFYYCGSLSSITIPASVISIGSSAFYSCRSLKSFTVDEGNTAYSSDEYGVLFNKDKTTLIKYPAGNPRTQYIIPDSVTSIGINAFLGSSSLKSVTISSGVTRIGEYAFGDCHSLVSITIPDSVTNIGDEAFYWCYSLASITIPDSVTSIGYRAFYWCRRLESITIPDSVTRIGDEAFSFCSEDLVITCYKDSAADTHAAEYGIAVDYIGGEVVQGDLDGDGVLSIEDAAATVNAILSGTALDNADMNGDGKISLIDVLRIMKQL